MRHEHNRASDLPQRLRHVVDQIMHGTVDGGAISTRLLSEAADEIDRLRSALIKSALMRTSAPQQ